MHALSLAIFKVSLGDFDKNGPMKDVHAYSRGLGVDDL